MIFRILTVPLLRKLRLTTTLVIPADNACNRRKAYNNEVSNGK